MELLSEREILSLVEPLLPNDVGIKFLVSTTNPKRLCVEEESDAGSVRGSVNERNGDEDGWSETSDDGEDDARGTRTARKKKKKNGALVDVEIVVGEERIRDAMDAVGKLCGAEDDDNVTLKTATPSAFEEVMSRAKLKRKTNEMFVRMPVACLETRCKRALFLVYPHRVHTLRTCTQFSSSVFGDSKSRRCLIARQLVEGLHFTHEKGLHLRGRFGLEKCVINEDKAKDLIEKNVGLTMTPLIEIDALSRASKHEVTSTPACSVENRDERDKEDATEEDRRNLYGLTAAWRLGAISNLEYISRINAISGRREGDFQFHAFMPWVIDFSKHPFSSSVNEKTTATAAEDDEDDADDKPLFGYRDLTKTKARLMKGDEMLDRSFENFGYHLLDDPSMSELGACVQSARNLSKIVLQKFVRPDWEPNEYPKSIQRVFETTPDECLPRFYYDPSIFKSSLIEDGLHDLQLPEWISSSGNAEEFIRIHRSCLESDFVSKRLHTWFDVHFGYQVGTVSNNPSAVAAKNTCKFGEDNGKLLAYGRMKVFRYPHPVRKTKNSPLRTITLNEDGEEADEDDGEYEDVLKKYRNVDLDESKDDVYVDALMTPEKTSKNNDASQVGDLRALGAALFTLFTSRDIPEHFREIREQALLDTVGVFADINDSYLESDTREEMRVLLDAMDDSNEIPDDVKDVIEKLIFDKIPPCAKDILKMDAFLNAKALEDLKNIRSNSRLGSTGRIVACDDAIRQALQSFLNTSDEQNGQTFKTTAVHASTLIEESMHAIACASKAHLEKYSRKSMERAMTSASLFQSCAEYLSALERVSRVLSTSITATNTSMDILRKPKIIAKRILLAQYAECLESGANEDVSSQKGGSSVKEIIQQMNEEGPSFRRELLHPAVLNSVASAVCSDFDFEEKILPSVLTIVTSSRADVNEEEFSASMLVLEQIISRLCMPLLLRNVVAPLISLIQNGVNRDADAVDRAKQAIEMIRNARRLPEHLDITEYMSLATTEFKMQKENVKKIERKKSREIALLSLERYVATGGDSGIADIDDDDDSEEDIDEAVVKRRKRGPWRFLPGDIVASSNLTALPPTLNGFFRDESMKPWVVRLETLAKWRAHSRGFGVDARKSIEMPNREPSNAKIYSRSVAGGNSRAHVNSNDFFDGNGALRVSESETRVLTCGAHYRGGLRRGTACRIWFLGNSPKNKESTIANAASFTQFRAPFAIHEPDANIRAGCFLDPQGETIATADDAGYLSLFLANANKRASNNNLDDTTFDDFDDDMFNDGTECPVLWRSRDKSLLSRRDGFSCLAHDSNLSNLVAGTLRGSIAIADCETGSFTRTHVLSEEANARVRSIECNGNSNVFCSYGIGSVAAVDARTCKVFANFQAHNDHCTRVRCLENHHGTNNYQFITSSNDGMVNVWDARKFSSRSAARVRSFHILPSDAYAHRTSSSGDRVKHRGKGNSICDFDMLDSKSCFVATIENGIGVFDVEDSSMTDDDVFSKVETRMLHDDGNSALRAIQILPRSRLFVALSSDGMVRVCR
jgi:WD40 repeat protein